MIRRPPSSTRTYPLFPYTTLFLSTRPRGTVLCISATATGAQTQFDACLQTGNQMALVDSPSGLAFFEQCNKARSEEHTSELQSLMRISYAVFCLKKTTYS